MKCLITAFDAFGKLKRNPSQLILERLNDSLKVPGSRHPVAVEKILLSTCCTASWKVLRPALAQSSEDTVLIMVGVATDRQSINLERFALNIRDYAIADNGGHRWQGRKIVSGGPDALATGVHLPTLARKLEAAGHVCRVSNHAGSFLCNEAYFRALNHARTQGRPGSVLFMHVPPPAVYARTAGLRSKTAALKALAEAVEDAASICVSRHARKLRAAFSGKAARVPEPNRKILKAAKSAVGQEMWLDFAATVNNGRLGCAASLTKVLALAGMPAANSDLVTDMVAQLKAAGFSEHPLAEALPGDIVYGTEPGYDATLGGGHAHIGVVGESGTTYDNRSSTGLWAKSDLLAVFNAARFGRQRWVLRAPHTSA
jgi:pyroglutamyl-peptidase